MRLPTVLDPTLVIRDYGTGISEEDIYSVYVRYGASTKRGTDTTVGMLGIGAKSAFAYSDSFTISSFYGGMRKVYTAILDSSHIGKMTKQFESESAETGVEIRIPVNPKDTGQFYLEAKRLFPFFSPQPKINTELVDIKTDILETDAGFLLKTPLEGLPRWTARMGCVPYRLTFDPIEEEGLLNKGEADYLRTLLNRSAGCLYFNLGDVDVSANREELEYTDRTKRQIVQKLTAIKDLQTAAMIKELEKFEGLQKRIKAIEMASSLGLSPAANLKYLLKPNVELYTVGTAPKPLNDALDKEGTVDADTDEGFLEPDPSLEETDAIEKLDGKKVEVQHRVLARSVNSFKLMRLESVEPTSRRRYAKHSYRLREDPSVPVNARVVLYLNDEPDSRKVKHCDGIAADLARVVQPVSGFSIETVRKELEEKLKEKELSGVLIKLLTSANYSPPRIESKGDTSRYRTKTLVWDGESSKQVSGSWEVSTEGLKPSDVFVILSKFCSTPNLSAILEDRKVFQILAPFDRFPKIHGVKTTDTEPVSVKDVYAVHYPIWKAAYVKELLARDTYLSDLRLWLQTYERYGNYFREMENEELDFLVESLGPEHPFVNFTKDAKEAAHFFNDTSHLHGYRRDYQANMLRAALATLEEKREPPLTVFLRKYPLWPQHPGAFGVELNEEKAPHWARYINLIDEHGA